MVTVPKRNLTEDEKRASSRTFTVVEDIMLCEPCAAFHESKGTRP